MRPNWGTVTMVVNDPLMILFAGRVALGGSTLRFPWMFLFRSFRSNASFNWWNDPTFVTLSVVVTTIITYLFCRWSFSIQLWTTGQWYNPVNTVNSATRMPSFTDLLVDFISTKNVEIQGHIRRAGGWLVIPRFVMARPWGFPQNLFKIFLIDLIVSGNYPNSFPNRFSHQGNSNSP